jgi:RNA 2',3'-cyclic 3'-phosphodiesterase
MSELARTFFALPVPDLARAALIAAQARMQRAHGGRLPLRFTRPEQLHVTLKFCGHVPRAQLPELCAISELCAAQCPPIDTRLTGVSTFGRPMRARALIAEIAPDPALCALAGELDAALEPLGIAREVRTFRPHVTLARIKRSGDARALIAAAKLEPMALRLDLLCCYESELGPQGSKYSQLAASPLCGA